LKRRQIFNRFSSIVSIVIFTIAFLILALLTVVRAAPPLPGYIYYDDFDGPSIDTALWSIFDSGNVLSQSDGFLYADGPPNSVYGKLVSIQTFRGDFEIVLQYSEFQSTATDFSGNYPQISLQVISSGDFIFINRGYSNGHFFATSGMINGEWQSADSVAATSSSGLLKISRTGLTISTHYNEGLGWVTLSSFPNAFANDANIQKSAYTGDNGTFHVASDGIYYKEPPITETKANTSDGPITISTLDTLSVTVAMQARTLASTNCDWWCAAQTPWDWYFYDYASNQWLEGLQVTHMGPCADIPTTEVLNMTLPEGAFTFYFGVDDNMNGTVDGNLYYDSVDVTVEP
jgi:hypothetical protein